MAPDAKEKKEGGELVTLSEKARDLSREILDILEARFGAISQANSSVPETAKTQNPIEQTHNNMNKAISNLEQMKELILMEIIEKL